MAKEDITIYRGCPFPMGVTKNGRNVNIAVSITGDSPLILILYKKNGSKVEIPVSDKFRTGNVYGILLKDFDYEKYEYNFQCGDRVFTDPYAKKISGADKWGSRNLRGCFYFGEDFEWGDDSPLLYTYDKLIIYQLHVRGFTKHSSSKVKCRGCFEGVVEKIPYLKELGINCVELMPVCDFDEIISNNEKPYYDKFSEEKPSVNYWGFSDSYYFAPKAAYSGIKNAPLSVKQMIKAMHENGIEVILQFYFPDSSDLYKIIGCLKYWVNEYHIDGFHILGVNIPMDVVAKEPMLTHTKIMYETVNSSEIYGDGKEPEFINFASYRDEFMYDARKYLKGDEDMLRRISVDFSGLGYNCGKINYITNYYGFTLNDLLSYERKHNEANGEGNSDGNDYNYSWNCGAEGPCRRKAVVALREKLVRNAFAFLLLSAGTPLIRAGDEFLNSQKGNNNAYCQDNLISYLNWEDATKNSKILSYVKAMIAFRKEHSILHPHKAFRMMDYASKGFPDLSYHGEDAYYPQMENYNRHIGMLYNGEYSENEEVSVMILYNMYWAPKVFALPKTKPAENWKIVVRTDEGFVDEGIVINDWKVTVPERSSFVLITKKTESNTKKSKK